MFDLRWITYFILRILKPRKAKFIWWGLDLGKWKIATKTKILIANIFNDPIVFYTEKTKNRILSCGLKTKNIFVANNTFYVPRSLNTTSAVDHRNFILSSGSFDKRKQHDKLVEAFALSLSDIPKKVRLVFIGDGSELDSIKRLCFNLNIAERVHFLGRIETPTELAKIYRKTIACASFGQAGLAVLQSLGFGVPYITKINAISGGEIDNITSDYNGILCEDSVRSLANAIIKVCTDSEYTRKMRENAKEYYEISCTIENMVRGFTQAFESGDKN
ncbi:glycosyltransferase [Bdellovibrio bacteriovorus]|uniref:glycosyltransferase n=1 Tax=Bdellovibrio bacteriovorus TaxID=959 RepID=UPI003A7F8045